MKLRTIGAVTLLAWVGHAGAEERIEMCAKYRDGYDWSKNYQVEGIDIQGFELNQKVGSFDYDGLARYVVIFWGPEQASIIKLDSSFPVSPLGSTGVDQRGTQWKVAASTFCM